MGGSCPAICVKIPPVVAIDSDFWAGRRVLVTGHTGFKGAWLTLWLQRLGAEVTGVSTGPPTSPSMYELAGAAAGVRELALDVRDGPALAAAFADAQPDVVLHLAGQPIVARAIEDPLLTYQINVLGVGNMLDAVRRVGGVGAVVVVTSDKCYENPAGTTRRHTEGDRLGGADPYSSSKACAELLVDAFRCSYFAGSDSPRVATARAGNVLGGGDWGRDRLLPDAVRSVQAGTPLRVRRSHAVRPWQHVLSALYGYLLLAERLWRTEEAARAWNFGPAEEDARPVSWIVDRLAELWNGAFSWEQDDRSHPPEADHLALDSSAARLELGWRPPWDLDQALVRLVEWHSAERDGADMRALTLAQIEQFAAAAAETRERGASSA
jgi:CDP-glucose 4,6-dehydratase